MPRPYICAFIGQKPSLFKFGYNEKDRECLEIKKLIDENLEYLINYGVKTFITSLSKGSAMWFTESIIKLQRKYEDVKLIAALSCETQGDNWSEEWQKRFYKLLGYCDEVLYISKEYTDDCIRKRNRWMLDNVNFVYSVFNGSEVGSTIRLLRYAGKKLYNIVVVNLHDAD